MAMRTVVRWDSFDATAAQLFRGIRKADEIVHAFELALCRLDDFTAFGVVMLSEQFGAIRAMKLTRFGRTFILLFAPVGTNELVFHTVYEGATMDAPMMFPHG